MPWQSLGFFLACYWLLLSLAAAPPCRILCSMSLSVSLPVPLLLFLPALLLLFVVSAALCSLLCRLASGLGLVAEPVARSAHSQRTPSSGGLVLLLVFAVCLGLLAWQGLLPLPHTMALAAVVFVALVGLWDDVRHIPPGLRVTLHTLAALWAVGWLGGLPYLDFGPWRLDNAYLMGGLTLLGLVWLLNLYNFMDGIDGIAGSQALFVILMTLLLVSGSMVMGNIDDGSATARAALGTVASLDELAPGLLWLYGALTAATAGFLCRNWPPARLFMGDSGSGLLGFSLGLLSLMTIQQTAMSLWTWLLLLGVFVTDATVTLLRRMLSGRRWYESHASHAYQYAARRYGSHGRVTGAVILINLLWLAPLAWLSMAYPGQGAYLALGGLAPLLALSFYYQAGVS